jgi:hypothetical protein
MCKVKERMTNQLGRDLPEPARHLPGTKWCDFITFEVKATEFSYCKPCPGQGIRIQSEFVNLASSIKYPASERE